MSALVLANMEKLNQLLTLQAKGAFGTVNGIVPTGTLVAICGYSFKASNNPDFVLNDGANVNQWIAGLGAGGEVEMEFHHPLIFNGFGITHGGTATLFRWNVSYKILGPVA